MGKLTRFGWKATLLVAALIATLPFQLAAHADALSPDNLKGFDGVLSRCVVSTDRKFAAGMCDRLVKSAGKQADANAVKYVHTGSLEWDSGMVSPQPPESNTFQTPLWLTFYIRGTGGNVPGALARASFHVPYAAAVEATGPEGTLPREGQLVLWEEATIGSGPAKQLGPAVADAVAKKMSVVFKALGDANK